MAESIPGLDSFMRALSGQESGDPNATNPDSGAHGIYQIMPANWPNWSREAGLPANAPQTAMNQETVARFKVTQYYRQYKDWGAVAAAWYGGGGGAQAYLSGSGAASAKQGGGKYPSINDYVSSVLGKANMGGGTKLMAASAGNASTTGTPAPSTTLDHNQLKAEFGAAAAIFGSSPELTKVIEKAIKDGVDPTTPAGRALFEQAIQATKWWKTTTAATRKWDQLARTDPSTALAQRVELGDNLGRIAHGLGFNLDGTRQRQIAFDALRFGWSPEKIKEAVTAEFHYKPGSAAPRDAQTGKSVVDEVTQIARSQLVPLADSTLQKWVNDIVKGTFTVQQFTEYAKGQAVSMFPSLKSYLDGGGTLQQYLNPYAQDIAGQLDMTADQVDFTKPKWAAVLQQRQKDGSLAPMTRQEAVKYARSLPEFEQSTTAKQSVADFSLSVGGLFGRGVSQ